MDSLEYQKRLAEFDEKISFYKLKVEELEHEKSRFVLEVLDTTIKSKKSNIKNQSTEVIGNTG